MSGGLSIPFAVLGLFGEVPGKPLFLVLAYVSLWVAIFSLAKKNLGLAARLKPKLRIACGKDVEGSVTGETELSFGGGFDFGGPTRSAPLYSKGIYYRIAVSANTVDAIQDCKGRLTRIEKDGRKLWGNDNPLLTFSKGEDPDSQSKTISDKTVEYLDVLLVTGKGEILPCTKGRIWPFDISFDEHFDEKGIYLLTVVISGMGTKSIEAVLEFNWTGNWKTSALSLLRQSPP